MGLLGAEGGGRLQIKSGGGCRGRGSLGRWGTSKDLEEVSCGFRCKFWGWPDLLIQAPWGRRSGPEPSPAGRRLVSCLEWCSIHLGLRPQMETRSFRGS